VFEHRRRGPDIPLRGGHELRSPERGFSPFKSPQRFLTLPDRTICGREIYVGVEVGWLELDCPLVLPDRVLYPAELAQTSAERPVKLRVFRPALPRSIKHLHGFQPSPLFTHLDAARHQRDIGYGR